MTNSLCAAILGLLYDEFVLGRWTRAMSLLDENAKPALEAQYMRIEDSR